MHKTKLLKLLGISLIVGILGLTGFCKKSKDNNDLALGAGLVVAQQQAEQAAYEAANNTDNPQWFCAQVVKYGTTYLAHLTPLVAQDCNVSYWGSLTNAIKQRLLETIDGDQTLSTNCPNTRNFISILDFASATGAEREKFIYVSGSSLLSEVGLNPSTYTVVSPNISKLYYLLTTIKAYANGISENGCVNAVNSKINNIPDSNNFCSNLANPHTGVVDCNSSGRTKVVFASCYYGSGAPSGSTICATLNDQF